VEYTEECVEEWSMNASDQQEYSIADLNLKVAELVDNLPNLINDERSKGVFKDLGGDFRCRKE
jgi:hypothetical protein